MEVAAWHTIWEGIFEARKSEVEDGLGEVEEATLAELGRRKLGRSSVLRVLCRASRAQQWLTRRGGMRSWIGRIKDANYQERCV